MADEAAIRDGLLALLPNLRAFAISLTGRDNEADDLVQDTILRAWSHLDRFEEGTNLGAWLFTILRNTFYSGFRKRAREVEDVDGAYSSRLHVPPTQGAGLEFAEFQAALSKLPPQQREAVLLVGAQGLSYEEASLICGCAVGTMKSRMHRARERLAQLLHMPDPDQIGPDQVTLAALQQAA